MGYENDSIVNIEGNIGRINSFIFKPDNVNGAFTYSLASGFNGIGTGRNDKSYIVDMNASNVVNTDYKVKPRNSKKKFFYCFNGY